MRLLCACALLLAPALAAQAPPGPSAKLTLLPAENAKLAASAADMSLLPKHSSDVSVDRKQIVHLTAPGQPELWFVPVRFAHGEPSKLDADHTLVERSRCGVFVMGPGGTHQQFVSTLSGEGDQEDMVASECGELKAISRGGDGLHPDIRLDYTTFAPPRVEDRVHVYLDWDAKAGRYKYASAGES